MTSTSAGALAERPCAQCLVCGCPRQRVGYDLPTWVKGILLSVDVVPTIGLRLDDVIAPDLLTPAHRLQNRNHHEPS